MATVIYDGDCGFCRWSLAVLLSLDRSGAAGLRPLPLGTAEADRLLGDLTVAEREASWHLVADAAEVSGRRPSIAGPASAGSTVGTVQDASAPARFSAGGALAPVLAALPHGRLPSAVFAAHPRAAERGYRWVAERRRPLGRLLPARARRWADRVIAAHGGSARRQ